MNATLTKKQYSASIAVVVVLSLFTWFTVSAQSTGTVTATVAVQNIAVSVSDGSIAYGTIASSGTETTINLSDTQTATNDGNVASTFNVKSQNATSGSGTDWTLASSVGADQYTHEVSTTTGSNWSFMSTSYLTATTSVPAGNTADIDFRVGVPSSSTDTDTKNADITVQVVAS